MADDAGLRLLAQCSADRASMRFGETFHPQAKHVVMTTLTALDVGCIAGELVRKAGTQMMPLSLRLLVR